MKYKMTYLSYLVLKNLSLLKKYCNIEKISLIVWKLLRLSLLLLKVSKLSLILSPPQNQRDVISLIYLYIPISGFVDPKFELILIYYYCLKGDLMKNNLSHDLIKNVISPLKNNSYLWFKKFGHNNLQN